MQCKITRSIDTSEVVKSPNSATDDIVHESNQPIAVLSVILDIQAVDVVMKHMHAKSAA